MHTKTQSGQSAAPSLSTVALTLGDPNGLGPELVCRIFGESLFPDGRILIIGPEQALHHHLRMRSQPSFWRPLPDVNTISLQPSGVYLHAPPSLSRLPFQPGLATIAGGKAAGESLEIACTLLDSHTAHALVTCPLNKAMLQQAGFAYAGHTEFLAARAGLSGDNVCMHFWGPELRVSLATTHPALRAVPELITTKLILHKLELTHKLMHSMDMRRPIAVCGLNPHAGEEGSIGDEEQRIITPAVAEATARGWNVVGPLAADTVFHRARIGDFSAVLAMYHDQGLAPFKLLHFHAGIQMTLGLPYVRTSPDHGTGYDLVGRDAASPESLLNAVTMALNLISTRQ
ncbi:4-hydroxythreonine-4-phosphate dehydrogenase [Desulfonatronum thiosulfatophilum]|uniref:4-hydroxythreonine-4-phosphate dehydrogenase n=1 Tax=Desulfonatronum thiosulfatophilum TaxID=617002 RepID=A0A1G6BIS6_9BACT|nr:4-hydroxythreonine-4-phosphate dehydrogenase PdxA [Desulfonatronum thiosulfatophilum]SDB20525.1 4-hydroxythreonine-4-phosphate dehydrogenase [Desulfonatronum thiosulfatophilum]